MSDGILAIDPGSETTGWAHLRLSSKTNDIELSSCGILKPPKSEETYDERFDWLVKALDELIAKKQPSEMAIEKMFVGPNNNTAVKLAGIAGAFRAVAVLHFLPYFEYEPVTWRASLGAGNLTKQQVKDTLAKLGLVVPPEAPLDVSDAVGIGRHHYYAVWYERLMEDQDE